MTTVKTNLDAVAAPAVPFQPRASVPRATVQAAIEYLQAVAAAKLDFITVTQAVNLDAIESRVNELDAAVVLKGAWDASAGTFPGAGVAQAGWSYIVSVAGTVDGVAFVVGDRIVCILDNGSTSTYASNWLKLDYTDQVLSVAGRTGAVVLVAADISDSGAFGRTLMALATASAGRSALDLATSTTAGRLARFTGTAGQQGQTSGLYEDGSGNVGIGATTPLGNLHVNAGTDRNFLVTTDATQQGTTGVAFGAFNDNASAYMPFSLVSSKTVFNSNVGIGTTSPSAWLDVNSDTKRLRSTRTPASATAAGNQGDWCYDADYIYVCTATNTWKRVAIATW